MLVLTRHAGERIVFPNLGMTLEVLRIQGSVARLGIKAPADIKILREELGPPSADTARSNQICADAASAGIPHALRNRLQSAQLALQLLRRQQELGMVEDAKATFEKVLSQFDALEREIAAGHRSPAQRPVKPPTQAATDPRPQALVVEDDANQCELLAGFLRISGFDVATASDGVDALDYLATHRPPDAVLLDMFMPRCDGAHTVTEIRCNPNLQGVKIFAVSGVSPGACGVAMGPGGVDRWFPKPLNPETLVQEVKREMAAIQNCGPSRHSFQSGSQLAST